MVSVSGFRGIWGAGVFIIFIYLTVGVVCLMGSGIIFVDLGFWLLEYNMDLVYRVIGLGLGFSFSFCNIKIQGLIV